MNIRYTFTSRQSQRLRFVIFFGLISAVFLLSACDPMCSAEVKAHAWYDENGNGVQDANEVPLENVAIDHTQVSGIFGKEKRSGFSGSDRDGEAVLMETALGHCPRYLQGRTRLPAGYAPTTSEEFNIKISDKSDATISFGFDYQLQITPTPRPTGSIDCYSIDGLDYDGITGVEFMPNGDVWVARYAPRGPAVTLIREGKEYRQNIEQFPDALDIAQAPDGSIWITGGWFSGIAHFDGNSWQLLTTENGLPLEYVDNIEVTPNGHVWVVGSGQLAEFDPSSETWFDRSEIGPGSWLLQTAEGDLWLVNGDPLMITRFNFNDPINSARKIGTENTEVDVFGIGGVTLTQEETLWIGGNLTNGEPMLVRFDSQEDQWSTLTYTNTLGAMPTDAILHVSALPDESIFVETFGQGGYHYIPSLSNDPVEGIWITYPDLSEATKTEALIPIDLPSSLDGFVSLQWPDFFGFNRICKLR